jgi:hypothetical protein
MFHGMSELGGQLTVRYEHESDHSLVAPVIAASQAHFMLASHSRRRERYLVDARRVDKPKIAKALAILTHCSKKSKPDHKKGEIDSRDITAGSAVETLRRARSISGTGQPAMGSLTSC